MKMRFKRTGAILLACAMLCGTVPPYAGALFGTAITANAAVAGKGTKESPYIVTTYDELREAMDMSKVTKAGTKRFVTLGNDITSEDDKNNYNLLMISSVETEVTLDLNGHSINRVCQSIDTALIQLGKSTSHDYDNCTLNIKDSKGGGKVHYKNSAGSFNATIYVWGGKLNIYGGSFSPEWRSDYALYTMNGETNIYGGTFTSQKVVLDHYAGNLYIHNGIFNCTVGDNDRAATGLYLSSNSGDFYIYNCTVNCTNKDNDYFGSISVGGKGTASNRHILEHLPSNVEVMCDGVKQNDLDTDLIKGRKIVITDKTDYNVDIKITEPKQGAKPSFKCTINNANVYLPSYMDPKQVFWHQLYGDSVHPMDETETFDLEKYDYKCYTTIKCDDYCFFKKAKITINGKPCIVTGTTSNEKDVSLTFSKKKPQKGDVTGDGKINTSDVTKVAAHVKGKKLLTKEQQALADIDGNGKVTITDLTRIAAHAKGKKMIQ